MNFIKWLNGRLAATGCTDIEWQEGVSCGHTVRFTIGDYEARLHLTPRPAHRADEVAAAIDRQRAEQADYVDDAAVAEMLRGVNI